MNTENPSSAKEMLPFAILAISIIILLVWFSQTIVFLRSADFTSQPPPAPQPVQQSADNATLDEFLTWELAQVATAKESVANSRKQLDETVASTMGKYDAEVTKADQVVTALKKLGNDLYELSKTDDGAKQVVENLDKLGIKFQGPATSQTPASSVAP